MLSNTYVALVLLVAGCGLHSDGQQEIVGIAPELKYGAEKLSIAVTTSERTSAPYTGSTYIMCSASCRYATGDNTVTAGAGDTLLGANQAQVLALDGEYVAFYSPSGTVTARVADWYVDKLSWTTLFPVSTLVPYTGLVQVVCSRRADLDQDAVPPGDGMTTLATGNHLFRMNGTFLSVMDGASNGTCYITGLDKQ